MKLQNCVCPQGGGELPLRSAVLFFAIGLIGASFGATAYGPELEDISVERGGTATISANSWYGNASVSGTLLVNANLFLVTNENSKVSSTLDVGPNAGDDALVQIASSKKIDDMVANAARYTLTTVVGANGGHGKVVLGPNAQLKGTAFNVSANAAADGDVIDVCEIGANAYVWLRTITSESAKPSRIKWTGLDGYIAPRNWGTKLFNLPSAGNEMILEGSPSCPVRISTSDQHYILLNKDSKGKLRFRGGGDVKLEQGYFSGGYRMYVDLSNANITWESIGDLILVNGGTRGGGIYKTSVDDVLPWGANVGNVRLSTADTVTDAGKLTLLDLSGHPQKVNGLVAENAIVSNSTGSVTLTFGDGNADGVLSADLSNPGIRPVKVGTGTLAISNATVDTFAAIGGNLYIPRGTTFSGRLLAVTNTTLQCEGSLDFAAMAIGDDVTYTYSINSTQTNEISLVDSYMGIIPYVKEGSSYLTCIAPADANGTPLHVKGGCLRFGGTPCANKYWRFIAKKSNGGKTYTMPDSSEVRTTLALGTIGLFSADGINLAGVCNREAAIGTEASELEAKYITSANPICVWNNTVFTDLYPGKATTDNPIANGGEYRYLRYVLNENSGTVSNAYDIVQISSWWGGVFYTNKTLVADNEDTWETVSWRLADDAAPAYSYNLARAVNFGNEEQVCDWELQSSPTGENGTWTTMDSRSGQTLLDTSRMFGGNKHVPFLFSALNGTWSFTTFGTVKVDAGATLDLSEIPAENIAINALEVDVSSGAGEIRRFVPAQSGTLCISGISGKLPSRLVLPLTLSDAHHVDRLGSWAVSVDGDVSRGSAISVEEGRLVVRTEHGTALILR